MVGHHFFKTVWTPVVEEVLSCHHEPNNPYDNWAIGVYRNDLLVGRVPREHSSQFYDLLMDGANIVCEITGPRENRRGRGLEVPCTYVVEL